MAKIYELLEIDVITLTVEDVVRTSDPGTNEGGGEHNPDWF